MTTGNEKHRLLNGDVFASSGWLRLEKFLNLTATLNNQIQIRARMPKGDWHVLLGFSYRSVDHRFSFTEYGSQMNSIDMGQIRKFIRDQQCDIGSYLYLNSSTGFSRWHVVGCSQEYSMDIRDKVIILDIDWTSHIKEQDAD